VLLTPVQNQIEANAKSAGQAAESKANTAIGNAVSKLNSMADSKRQEAINLSSQSSTLAKNPTADYVSGAIGLALGTSAALKYAFNVRHNRQHKQNMQAQQLSQPAFNPSVRTIKVES
jgi:hypothetical protein